MKILFTKKNIDKKLVSKSFGTQFDYDFIDVIRIKHLEVAPFNLKNKSLIFTSVNGVQSFFENGFVPNEKFTDFNYNKIYCVGKKTKKEIRKFGFGVFKMKKNAKDLADFIIENAKEEKFLHFCGNLALDVLDRAMPLQNFYYKKVIVYETELIHPIINNEFSSIVFFSPSGVKSYVKYNSLAGKKIFSIGTTTEEELKKHTEEKIFTSKESHLEDLVNLIIQKVSK